jgi:L-lysine 2,3-aminomutase
MREILATKAELVEATLAPVVADQRVGEKPADSWQNSMKNALRSSRQLLAAVGLTEESSEDIRQAEKDFPVFAPLEYVARMRLGDADDPLLRQVLARGIESQDDLGQLDPVGDSHATIVPGLLQKYQRRALLITSGACAIHCRYCFRRHFPYQETPVGPRGWGLALEAIGQDRSLDELILSGGDPLSAIDLWLDWLVEQINSIEHIQRLRIHTRFPVVIPARISQSLLTWVAKSRPAIYFVLHFNHANELDAAVIQSLDELTRAGAVLLNQSVLLQDVNDNFQAQRDLCLKLINHRVIPYYLHQLDPVRGAQHFEVSDQKALELIEQLRIALPGYAVPRLVRELAGQPHKTPISG